ncbi:phosphodiesterase [Aquibaculum sediminis]|uniref:phosphodiesterase n=1 Tax=Aquibaculum sediminis TaxID=3231907 RepID=UPI0034564906
MLIAQLSDPHVMAPGKRAFDRIDTAAMLAQAVARLMRFEPQPDAVLLTGDLADGGAPAPYRELRRILAPLPMPVYLLPGNHDDRQELRAAFPEADYLKQDPDFLHFAVDLGPCRLLALDSLLPGSINGELCDRRLAWTEARLQEEADKPVIMAIHHPPFTTGLAKMDAYGLKRGGAELAAIVARHPRVERLLCGHLHRPIQVRWAGTLAMTAPSTAHQMSLDLRPDAPLTMHLEPPGFLLHQWIAGQGLVSHLLPSGDFEGPLPLGGGH